MHGIGTRSIKRVVAKYNGNLEMKFNSDTNTFTSTIGINSNIQIAIKHNLLYLHILLFVIYLLKQCYRPCSR